MGYKDVLVTFLIDRSIDQSIAPYVVKVKVS